jgi:hypothetical protein
MQLTIRNYPPIKISDKLLVPLEGEFKGDTSYVAKLAQRLKRPDYLNNKLPAKLLCLEALARRAEKLGGWNSFAEPMAGVGLSARIFGGGKRKLILGDLDKSCRKALTDNFTVTPSAANIFTEPVPSADMVFLDFNDFTYRRGTGVYEKVLAKTFRAARKFVIINDCTVFYFRYGKQSYKTYSEKLQTSITSFTDYFYAIDQDYGKRYKWHLAHVAYFRDSSFQLYTPRKTKIIIEEVKARPIVEIT